MAFPGGMNLDYYDFEEDTESIPVIEKEKGYKIVAVHSGKALALKTNNTTNGTKIIQKDYTGDDTEIWKLNVAGDACYSLQNVASGLSIVLRGTDMIGQFPFDCTVNNGKWNLYYQGDNSFTIMQKGSLKNLGISDNSMDEGAELSIGEPTGGDNQKFRIEEVADYTGIDQTIVPEYSVGVAYPNPFVDELYIPISVNQPQDIEISVFDLTGRCVYKNIISVDEGNRELCISGKELTSGIYVWRLNGESTHAYGRVIKK